MKKDIKVGDNTFEFNFPIDVKNGSFQIMQDWCKLIKDCTCDKDSWYEIPQIPGYKFKNLKLIIDDVSNLLSESSLETSFKIVYDDYIDETNLLKDASCDTGKLYEFDDMVKAYNYGLELGKKYGFHVGTNNPPETFKHDDFYTWFKNNYKFMEDREFYNYIHDIFPEYIEVNKIPYYLSPEKLYPGDTYRITYIPCNFGVFSYFDQDHTNSFDIMGYDYDECIKKLTNELKNSDYSIINDIEKWKKDNNIIEDEKCEIKED
jgi:hypothetical protein